MRRSRLARDGVAGNVRVFPRVAVFAADGFAQHSRDERGGFFGNDAAPRGRREREHFVALRVGDGENELRLHQQAAGSDDAHRAVRLKRRRRDGVAHGHARNRETVPLFRREHDARLLAGGADQPRFLPEAEAADAVDVGVLAEFFAEAHGDLRGAAVG